MPRMDGTGPVGQGPMTGRGFGNCIKQLSSPQQGLNAEFGCGMGRRKGNANQGRGFGWRNQQIVNQENK